MMHEVSSLVMLSHLLFNSSSVLRSNLNPAKTGNNEVKAMPSDKWQRRILPGVAAPLPVSRVDGDTVVLTQPGKLFCPSPARFYEWVASLYDVEGQVTQEHQTTK